MKKKRAKKSIMPAEDVAARLERAADEAGMAPKGVAQFDELLEPFGIQSRQCTPSVIRMANAIVQRKDEALRRRVSQYNQSRKTVGPIGTDDNNRDVTNSEAQTKGQPVMAKTRQISQELAVAVLVALGIKTAGKYTTARLLKKLEDLPKLATDAKLEKIEDDKLRDRASKLAKFVAGGNTVELKEEAPAEPEDDGGDDDGGEEEATPKKSAKGKKSTKGAKGAKGAKGKKSTASSEKKPAAKKTVPRDGFGNKVGTSASDINLALPAKGTFSPNDVQETIGDDGVTVSRVRDHFRTLLTKGFIEKTDKGYRLVKGAPKRDSCPEAKERMSELSA